MVFRCKIRLRTKFCSSFAFSKIVCGLSEGHRRKFGANTIARLFTVIFVIGWLAGSPINLKVEKESEKGARKREKGEKKRVGVRCEG